MNVDARAQAFLTLVDENKDLAYRLLSEYDPPRRWVVIIAFYAAVHYIGA